MSGGLVGERPRPRDRVLPFTRWLSLVILPFLVAASVLLYILPTTTEQLFAWTITPALTAMFLGAAYLGGIWFFAGVLRTRHWHRVKYGFPAVVVFSTLMGVATLLHWDRFHFGHLSFITWVTLYLTTPFLTAAAAIANWRAGPGTPDQPETIIPRPLRFALGALGVAAVLVGLALFIAPVAVGEAWAWSVTPLTGRVVGAVLTLPGLVNVWLFVDDRWSAFRWIFAAQIFSLAFIIVALLAAGADLDWSRPAAGWFTVGIAVSFVAYVGLFIYCELRRFRAGGAGV